MWNALSSLSAWMPFSLPSCSAALNPADEPSPQASPPADPAGGGDPAGGAHEARPAQTPCSSLVPVLPKAERPPVEPPVPTVPEAAEPIEHAIPPPGERRRDLTAVKEEGKEARQKPSPYTSVQKAGPVAAGGALVKWSVTPSCHTARVAFSRTCRLRRISRSSCRARSAGKN